MFSAVSNLSPVNIQIFIPALYKSEIVSGTLSCRRSSTQVAPTRTKSRSNSLYNACNDFSLVMRFLSASSHLFRNYLTSYSSSTFIAINRVLKPLTDADVKKSSTYSIISCSICAGSSLSLMIESAPLQYSL